jgi:FMN phosphatase YigB (HAD superfamily)
MPIELIAFDIGGVLATRNHHLFKHDKKNLFGHDFLDLQRGKININFYLAKFGVSKSIFENLLKTHENIYLLKKIRLPYIFASNINSLHYENFIHDAQPNSYALKNSILSYKIGYLKPDPLFFEYLVKKNHIPQNNILFIDDKPENIKSAEASGLSVLLCQDPRHLGDLLKNYWR